MQNLQIVLSFHAELIFFIVFSLFYFQENILIAHSQLFSQVFLAYFQQNFFTGYFTGLFTGFKSKISS